MPATDHPSIYHFLTELDVQLDAVRDADKALKTALRATREFFGADAAAIAVRGVGKRRAEIRLAQPQGVQWDGALLGEFLAERRPRMPDNTRLAPLERRGRRWGALAVRRRRGFDADDLRGLTRIADALSKHVQRIDRTRLAEVRERIDHKMMEQIRPKDLFYQILHGLRSLTRYDHSAALLIYDEDGRSLELVAEQIAWRKGKSARIGAAVELPDELRALLETRGVFGFDRKSGSWRQWSGHGSAVDLPELLDERLPHGPDDRRGLSVLCAPLASRHGVLGALVVTSCHPGSLGVFEADLVARFLPQAAVAVRNLRRAESLEVGMLEAEKKHVMADLARGVSHDVNNAVGAVLPLVQQLAAEAREGEIDAEVLVKDLEQVEESLQVCRRIFGSMLSLARGSERRLGDGDVRRALQSTLAVLEESMRRAGVDVVTDVADGLPMAHCPQSDLEQLLLNLATNARDAMSRGGRLALRARTVAPGALELEIEDDGTGIAPELKSRIHEPFFTTKRHGNGLGLAICRSIVWNASGRLTVDSEPGCGTCVRVQLPAAGSVGGTNR